MPGTADVAVLIVANNAAWVIGSTVRTALDAGGARRVVVIDTNSNDETALVAERAGAKVVRMFGDGGKGAALEAGIKRVENADVIVIADADLGTSAAAIAELTRPIADDAADMVIGVSESTRGDAGSTVATALGRWATRALGRSDTQFEAPLSAQRAIRGSACEGLRPFAGGYGVEVALTVRALRQGLRVVEVTAELDHQRPADDPNAALIATQKLVQLSLALVRLRFSRRERLADSR